MTKPYASYFLLLIFSLASSCTEDYRFSGMSQQTVLVITGIVTNEPGPYYVRIVENISDLSSLKTIERPVDNAHVTLTDSRGNTDQLRSFYSVPVDSVWTEYERYRYFLNIPGGNDNSTIFELEKDYYDDYDGDFREDIREGAYFTTSTRGTPGNTYTLKVEYGGREYTATDYMCYGTVIDSVSIEPVGRYIYDKPDGSDGFMVPCLYFAEPQDEVNFYMFKEVDYERFYDPVTKETLSWPAPAKKLALRSVKTGDWYLSAVSDRFMPPYVSKYKMSDGDSERKWFNGTDMGFYERWENGGCAGMYCISEPVYRFYDALSQQYYDDGNAFSPSPASPPTNFSGGAQGCFSAAPFSQYCLDLGKQNEENKY